LSSSRRGSFSPLKEARSILAQSQRAVQLAQAASRGEAGHLEIAYAVLGFEPVVLRVVRLFRRLLPMVELGIRELQYHQQIQELLNQRIDIGYVGIRFPELESESVEVEFRPLRPSIPTFNFHIAWRRDKQSSVLQAFLEMLRKHAHAEAKGPEKTAVARHSDRNLYRKSEREVGAAKSGGKTTTNGR